MLPRLLSVLSIALGCAFVPARATAQSKSTTEAYSEIETWAKGMRNEFQEQATPQDWEQMMKRLGLRESTPGWAIKDDEGMLWATYGSFLGLTTLRVMHSPSLSPGIPQPIIEALLARATSVRVAGANALEITTFAEFASGCETKEQLVVDLFTMATRAVSSTTQCLVKGKE